MRYSKKISLPDSLVQPMNEAEKEGPIPVPDGPRFYKVTNSGPVEWFVQSGYTVPMEHHVFPVPDGVIDIVSDYQPNLQVKKKKDQARNPHKGFKSQNQRLFAPACGRLHFSADNSSGGIKERRGPG
ncbi:MAG: hypothetical protein C6W57_00325 [Caldibacillus debilis]|nr:MAG: hypothetical protein C6W57_00325 [Caldibacillus debilis]